jgi:hypothetical protein
MLDKRDLDKLDDLNQSLRAIAHAVTPPALPGRDAAEGVVTSLTEAAMGFTAGLFRIAQSLDNVADAIRESRNNQPEG